MPQLKPLLSAGPAGQQVLWPVFLDFHVVSWPLGRWASWLLCTLGKSSIEAHVVIVLIIVQKRKDFVERVNKRKLKWKPLIIPGRHETKQITIHLIWRAPPACWKTLWVPHQTLLLCHRFLGIHVSFCTSKCTLLLDGAPSYCVGREFRHSLQMMLCSWRQQAPLFFKHAKCFVKLLWFANPCQTRSECCFSWVPKPYTLQEAFANAYIWPSPSQDRKGALVL